MRILAVDDDTLLLELLQVTLQSIGHHDLALAESAAEALDLVEAPNARFDCILLDIQMPEMDGIELLTELRTRPAYRDVPVLMLTAMSDREFIDRAFAAGATDYVTKPFEIAELSARLRIAERLSKSAPSINVDSAGPVENAMRVAREIPGLIDRNSLENYMAKLSTSKAFLSSAVALQIVGADGSTDKPLTAPPPELVREAATQLAQELAGTDHVLAYLGEGLFVAITRLGDPVAAGLQMAEFDLGAGLPDAASPAQARLMVGRQVSNSAQSLATPMKIVEDCARSVREAASVDILPLIPNFGTEVRASA